ncbi:general secretion pathway protein GspE [Myxococcaceae bacterium GXIMD 01537]
MKAPHLATPPAPRKRRLGEILLDAGLLTEPQLLSALAEQRKWGGRLGHTLVQLGFVNEGAMAHALSHQLDLPTVDLDEFEPAGPVNALLRVELAERYGVFPVAQDAAAQALTLATSDPTNAEALQELAFHTGRQLYVMVSSPSAIERAIRLHYHGEIPLGIGVPTVPAAGEAAGSRAAPESAPGSASARAPMPLAREGDLQQRVEALAQQVEDLQRMVASQARAIHGLVELLENRGVVNRADYLAKVRGA